MPLQMMWYDYLLVLLAVGRLGIVASQSCSEATDEASRYLDPQGACGAEPECYCDYSPAGFYFSSCIDSRRHCSALDPDVCGTQLAVFMYTFYPYFTDYGVTYEWTYDGTTRGETLRYQFNSADQSCAMVIIDDQNVQTECSCRLTTTCSGLDPSFSYAQIDCTNYESGAVANECLPNLGVETGSVLEGLAVTWSGMCVSGGDVGSPMATPAPSDGGDGGSSPTQAPSSAETSPVTTPPPSPAPSEVDLGSAPTQPPSSAETVPISTPPPSSPPSAVEVRPAPTQAPSGENVRSVPTRAPLGADGDANPAPAPSGGGEDGSAGLDPTSPGAGTNGIDAATTSEGSCTFSAVRIVALACSAVGAWVGTIIVLA